MVMGIYIYRHGSNVVYSLITFANSLDLDQARQNIGPDLDSICLHGISERFFPRKIILILKQTTKMHAKLPRGQRVTYNLLLC